MYKPSEITIFGTNNKNYHAISTFTYINVLELLFVSTARKIPLIPLFQLPKLKIAGKNVVLGVCNHAVMFYI